MQDILKNISEDKQLSRAWIIALSLVVFITLLMSFGNAGDTDTTSILSVDPMILLLTQAVFSIICFFGASLLVIYYVLKLDLKFFFKRIELKDFLLLLGITFSFLVVLSAVGEWNMNLDFPDSAFEEWAKSTEETLKVFTEHLTNFESPIHFLIALIVIAVIPGVSEELLFRGLLQNSFKKITRNPHLAIWVSAIILGVIHLQFYGVFPRIFLGALFGYLYFWSGNLSIAILGHVINNSIGVTLFYLYQQGTMDISPEKMEQSAPWPALLIFGIACIFLLRYFYLKYSFDE